MVDKIRRVRHAGDDDESEFGDSQVYTISKREVSAAVDPFNNLEELKKLGGVRPALKRRMTNELKKYNRSADGKVESKQLDDEEIFTGYDAFGVVEPDYRPEMFTEIYRLSAGHYAAVNAKVSNIVGLGYKFVQTRKTTRALEAMTSAQKAEKAQKNLEEIRDTLTDELEAMNEEYSFTETLQRVWTDYEVTGNGYLEIGRKRDGTVGYIGHIPSHTVRIRRKRDGFVQVNGGRAVFFRNFADNASNPVGEDSKPNEIIHIARYAPGSDYYGVPDIIAAQQAVAGSEFAGQFNLDYFENKAVPRHVVTLKGANLAQNSINQLLEFFETGLKGQNHRSLFIPLPADGPNGEKVEFKIDTIEQGTQDAAFNNYRKSNLNEILMAHRVPISKVSTADAASLAIAKDADKTFKEQVCQPQQSILESKINRIIKEMTDAFELEFNEMALTDTNTQSQIDERMVKTGVWTPNEIRTRDGMSKVDGGDERTDLNAAAKLKQQQNDAAAQAQQSATPRARDAVRSANATDTAGNARNPKGEGRTTQ